MIIKQRILNISVVIVTILMNISVVGYAKGAHDQINNSSFETAGAVLINAFDWQDFMGGYSRVSTARTGSWGIALTNNNNALGTFAGAFQRLDLAQTTKKPVFIGGYVKGSNINPNISSGLVGGGGASLYAEIHLMDGSSIAYWNSVSNSGTFDWRKIGFNTSTLPAVNQPIDFIYIVPLLGQASGTAYFDDITVEEQTLPFQAAVTLMFDDGGVTDFTIAKPILDANGFRGTSAVPSGLVGQSGYLSSAQLLQLQAAGWEIMSHGINHTDLTTLSFTDAVNDLINSKTQLQVLGLQIYNYAFPFGAYNGNLLGEGHKYYRSLRAFEIGSNPKGNFTGDIKVASVVSNTTVSDVAGLVQQAQLDRTWLVLVFHKLTNQGDDQYYTEPVVFQEIVEYLRNADVLGLTYNEGLDTFTSVQ